MTPGEKLHAASLRAVSRFANKGILLEPSQYDYDPSTGDSNPSYKPHALEYVPVDNKTAKTINIRAASHRQSLVYFTTTNLSVNETWVIATGEDASSVHAWEDLLREEWIDLTDETWVVPYLEAPSYWDIKETEKIEANGIVIGYYALMEVRQ